MKVVFLSNYLTHHQKPLADEMYKLLGEGNYVFVNTEEVSEERKQMGWPVLEAPYLKHYNESKDEVDVMVRDFDVVIYAQAPLAMIKDRYKSGKLVLCNTERRYKTLSRYLKYPINTYKSYYINKGYFLASSAFAPKDYWLSGMPLCKCFMWGYFPEVKTYEDIYSLIDKKGGPLQTITILWAGRLIGWKHPEVAIHLAKRLVKEGVKFKMDIIGNGLLEDILKRKIEEINLSDKVHLLGSMAPSQVREYMEKSDIYIFTSDRNEGWGAVLNESMNSACAVVASDAIGSVPYLVKDGVNGMIYKSENQNDLFAKVKYLIEHPAERKKMQKAAYKTVRDIWSPASASKNLITLFEALLKGDDTPILDGPGSKAPLIWDKYLI